MINESTVGQLYEMRLGVMAQCFKEQCKDGSLADMPFEERFGILVNSEWSSRKSKQRTRLIRNAGFAITNACVEDIEYHPERKLDKAQIMRLASCAYIQEGHNIIILGATGSGKTYLSNAFGISAARNFYTVKYARLTELLGELAIARGEGTYQKVIKAYQQVKLLILDDWLLFPLKESQYLDLFEIVEARVNKASTIFCSQFEVGGWHSKIGETTLAEAIIDRIAHYSSTIVIGGEISMRERKGIAKMAG
ncbi:MAG: IS21-like element helper ATPase IstB [Candidatus Adiutrix sp.]|jgi:DNA replication protein DnaC|nr:IS21-like element helper ATPase IstB [Candidatus Adiutrix sp.]